MDRRERESEGMMPCTGKLTDFHSYDQPGLKEMTLKAIDILTKRSKDRDTGFMLMSEAAVSLSEF